MKRTFILALAVVMLIGLTSAVAYAGGNGALKGTAYDPNCPELGEITYLGNHAGYHFWFTVTADVGPYVEGHSYHNIYKFQVDDPENWQEFTTNADRPPYNLVVEPGTTLYYKVWDVTAETWVIGGE